MEFEGHRQQIEVDARQQLHQREAHARHAGLQVPPALELEGEPVAGEGPEAAEAAVEDDDAHRHLRHVGEQAVERLAAQRHGGAAQTHRLRGHRDEPRADEPEGQEPQEHHLQEESGAPRGGIEG